MYPMTEAREKPEIEMITPIDDLDSILAKVARNETRIAEFLVNNPELPAADRAELDRLLELGQDIKLKAIPVQLLRSATE